MQELHNVKGSRKNGIYVDCKQLAMRLYKLSFTKARSSSVILEDKNYGTFFDFRNYRQRAVISGYAPYFFWLYIKVKDTEKRLQRGDSDMKEMFELITDIRIDVAVFRKNILCPN